LDAPKIIVRKLPPGEWIALEGPQQEIQPLD